MPEHNRVLVIDDEPLDRSIAMRAALQAGYQAVGAGGISEARDLLSQDARFECVVLDLSLGSNDGIEIFHTLARLHAAPAIIFVSGFDRRVLGASRRVAASLGHQVAGVLQKPLRRAELCKLLLHLPRGNPSFADAVPMTSPEQLHGAIARGDIRPWFQPKISLATGELGGAEALARWIQPDGLTILPGRFVPAAEQSGSIAVLTDIILGQALAACAAWRKQLPICSVAVNLFPRLLEDQSLTDRIERQLQAHGVPPGALILEITETAGIPDTPRAIEVLTRLRIKGVQLSIDDFGTGHSNLLSLIRLPFSEIKIDQAFVREASVDRDARKVVFASASLGRELGLRVVAEGIETEADTLLVTEAGCDLGQGWLYGAAMPADRFTSLVLSAPSIEPQKSTT